MSLKKTIRNNSYYLLDKIINGNPDLVKVVIYAQGRSGSSLLSDLLASTGYFKKHGELLKVRSSGVLKNPVAYLEGRSKRFGRENFLFHLKPYHLCYLNSDRHFYDPGKLLRELKAKNWVILYLRRENKMLHTLSNVLKKQRGKSHKRDSKKESFKLKIDLEDFEKKLNRRIYLEHLEGQHLKGLDHHTVNYEKNLIGSGKQQKTINNFLKSIDLPEKKVLTKHRKINKQPLEDLIINYDEFQAMLEKNGWGNYLTN